MARNPNVAGRRALGLRNPVRLRGGREYHESASTEARRGTRQSKGHQPEPPKPVGRWSVKAIVRRLGRLESHIARSDIRGKSPATLIARAPAPALGGKRASTT